MARGPVHHGAGSHHAVPVGGDGFGFGFHEAARCEVLPHHHVPAVRGAGRGVDFGVGFMYGAKYGLVGSLNDWLGTNLDVLSPNVLLAAIGNIVTGSSPATTC